MSSDASQKKVKELLPHGAQSQIAQQLGITKQAVSQALEKGLPNHPAVIEAVRLIKKAGSIKTAQALASINA